MTETTRDSLTGALIGLVRAANGSSYGLTTAETDALLLRGLTAAEDFGTTALLRQAEAEKARLAPNCALCTASCGRTENYDVTLLRSEAEPARTQKLRILAAARELAGRLSSAESPSRESCLILYQALFAIGEPWDGEQLEGLLRKLEAR